MTADTRCVHCNGLVSHGQTCALSSAVNKVGGFKLMPRDPTDAMLRAIERYFYKWDDIAGTDDDDQVKAYCWSALQVYLAMYDAAPGAARPEIIAECPECNIRFDVEWREKDAAYKSSSKEMKENQTSVTVKKEIDR